MPGPAERHRWLSAEIGERHRRHRPGNAVDATLAVSIPRREKVVHHCRRDRPTGLRVKRASDSTRLLARHPCLLSRTELGLGDAVDTVKCGLVDTDIFTDHFGRDAGVA